MDLTVWKTRFTYKGELRLFVLSSAEEAMVGSGAGGDAHTPDELAGLTPEQAEQLRAEWSRELARVEDEIATLRTVLQSKVCSYIIC